LIIAALVLGLVSCSDGSASIGGDDGATGGRYKFEGHYDVYEWNSTLPGGGSESKEEILKVWLNGGFSKTKSTCVYFNGNEWYRLVDNKVTASGTFSLRDDDHIVTTVGGSYLGTRKFTVIEKDTIYFNMIDDGNDGEFFFSGSIIKKSSRKGHIEVKNQAYWFVDD